MVTYKTTKERRANLVQLARFLYTEPIEAKRFNMQSFSDDGSGCAEPLGCSTSGCAVGWGPTAGIESLENEDWFEYSYRVLVPRAGFEEEAEADTSNCWEWCFHAAWAGYDNTAKGAAKRILWLLLGLVPDDWMYYQVPYRDWTPTESDWQLAAQDSEASP